MNDYDDLKELVQSDVIGSDISEEEKWVRKGRDIINPEIERDILARYGEDGLKEFCMQLGEYETPHVESSLEGLKALVDSDILGSKLSKISKWRKKGEELIDQDIIDHLSLYHGKEFIDEYVIALGECWYDNEGKVLDIKEHISGSMDIKKEDKPSEFSDMKELLATTKDSDEPPKTEEDSDLDAEMAEDEELASDDEYDDDDDDDDDDEVEFDDDGYMIDDDPF